MREPSDLLAYRLYEVHQQRRGLSTKWGDLGSHEKNHWRALAVAALEFCQDLIENEGDAA